MNEQKRYKIAVLAEDANNKKERFQNLGIMNTPQDPVERAKSRIQYEIARAEWLEAERLLREVVEGA